MISTEYLLACAHECGVVIPAACVPLFDSYAGLLIRWNRKMNLTAIVEPDAIIIKHFIDSLMALKAVEMPMGASVVDIGTGAGFPGVPLKLVRTDLALTLIDSLGKRTVFLTELCQRLGIGAEIVHGRAEELVHQTAYRECYDFAVARAVAKLQELAEYCLPYVKPGGYFLALKGPSAQQEAEEAKEIVKMLGGQMVDNRHFCLPNGEERCIVIIKKISQTSAAYPRKLSLIRKTTKKR